MWVRRVATDTCIRLRFLQPGTMKNGWVKGHAVTWVNVLASSERRLSGSSGHRGRKSPRNHAMAIAQAHSLVGPRPQQ